jgi:hypothetical protein
MWPTNLYSLKRRHHQPSVTMHRHELARGSSSSSSNGSGSSSGGSSSSSSSDVSKLPLITCHAYNAAATPLPPPVRNVKRTKANAAKRAAAAQRAAAAAVKTPLDDDSAADNSDNSDNDAVDNVDNEELQTDTATATTATTAANVNKGKRPPIPDPLLLQHAIKLVWLDRTVRYTDAIDIDSHFFGLFTGGALGLVRCCVADSSIRDAQNNCW